MGPCNVPGTARTPIFAVRPSGKWAAAASDILSGICDMLLVCLLLAPCLDASLPTPLSISHGAEHDEANAEERLCTHFALSTRLSSSWSTYEVLLYVPEKGSAEVRACSLADQPSKQTSKALGLCITNKGLRVRNL